MMKNTLRKAFFLAIGAAVCAAQPISAQTARTSAATAKQYTIADRAATTYTKAVKVVSNGELNLKSAKSIKTLNSNTIYVISDNVSLGGGTLQLSNGTCLKMMGGSISNGTIKGDGSIIDAPEYRIFYSNVKIAGNFANAFPIEWWGAVASSSVDSAPAINAAIQSMVINNMETTNLLEAVNLVAHGTEYHIHSTILLNKKGTSLHFDGDVVASGGVTAFDVSQHHISLKIKKLESELKETDTPVASCSGVLISYNCYHSDFDIHAMYNFGKGFNLCPRCKNNNNNNDNDKEVAGIQYCKFTFQELVNVENIVFDLDGTNNGKGLWINENQFFGGRVGGRVGGSINGKNSDYGIRFYGSHISNKEAEKKGAYDCVNGNVFYSIGFEAVEHPIYGLWRWCNDQFHDLRMSESIGDEKYITLGNCESLRFSVKSDLYAYHVKKNSDDEIEKEWYAMAVSVNGDSVEDPLCKNVIFEDPIYIHYIDGNVVKSIKISDIYNNTSVSFYRKFKS